MKVGDIVKCELVFEVTETNGEVATISVVNSPVVFEERGFNNLELILNQMQLLDGTKFQIVKEN
ncbi:MAG: hypothetical protein MJ250_08850 [Alphaproteobacteria bacterium]|nr:hypothetical protein [Alphaproteobacteria bacterium]